MFVFNWKNRWICHIATVPLKQKTYKLRREKKLVNFNMHMDLTYFILPESLLKRKYELSISTISVVMPENDLQLIH